VPTLTSTMIMAVMMANVDGGDGHNDSRPMLTTETSMMMTDIDNGDGYPLLFECGNYYHRGYHYNGPYGNRANSHSGKE